MSVLQVRPLPLTQSYRKILILNNNRGREGEGEGEGFRSLPPLLETRESSKRKRKKEQSKLKSMQPGARRRARNSSNNGIIPGSIWETRMKMDEVKGGIKVFNGGDTTTTNNDANADEEGIRVYRRLRRNQSDSVVSSVVVVERKKRRNWKPPEPVAGNGVLDKSSVQLRKARSEISRISNAEVDEEEEEEEDEIEIEGDVKSFDDKEIDLPKVVVEEEKKTNQIDVVPILPEIEEKKDSVIDLKKMDLDPDPVKQHPIEVEEEMMEIGSETTNRIQNIVDLVMWRDIPKSAFVFGSGTFLLLSSSYTKDIDFSLLSAISYLGLVYLALIFLYKSILRRGAVEFDEREERCIIGEDEAIWALRFVLPYINEVLIKIKALFSGDPSTTMKLAALLFVTARCGSSITLWTLAKIVFFGVFTIPKVLSSYSVQLTRYGKFWLERFRDGWESCSNKKVVAAAIFILIWNISSTIARIWAVFMLVVAVKLYQQCTVEWSGEEQEEEENNRGEQERQEDSKSAAAEELSTAVINNNAKNNRLQVLYSRDRQRHGPSRATVGKEREKQNLKNGRKDNSTECNNGTG